MIAAQDLVEAGAGSVAGRRRRRARHRHQRGDPALGGQLHDDERRRDVAQLVGGLGARRRASAWSPRPAWDGSNVARRRPVPARRRRGQRAVTRDAATDWSAGDGAPRGLVRACGHHRHRGVRHVSPRTSLPASGAATCCTASPSTRCRPPGSARRRGSAPQAHPADRHPRGEREARRRERLGGVGHRVVRRRVAGRAARRPRPPAGLVAAAGWSCPPGATRRCSPVPRVADLLIYLMWSMEGRGAQEGRTAFSRAGGTRSRRAGWARWR